MLLREFNSEHNAAKRRIQREGVDAVEPAERALRDLLLQLESDEDRRLAVNLIKRLPGYALRPAPPSELMKEAVAIERAAYEAPGTDEERIAIMADARRKIFEIADRRSPKHPRPDPRPRTPRGKPPRPPLALR